MYRSTVRRAALACALVAMLAAVAAAQKNPGTKVLTCGDGSFSGDGRESFCAVREQKLESAPASVSIDPGMNGGIEVYGWDGGAPVVRAKVQTNADTLEEAKALAEQIRIETDGGRIRAVGPEQEGRSGWAVSFQVFVPSRTDLSLRAFNGGIAVEGMRGRTEFETTNGGVALRDLSGSVRGETTNGGVSVALSGNRWDGEGLDVRTTNGGITLNIPEGYAAHLETGTVHGGMSIDYPVTVQGKIGRQLSIDLGAGGAPVRVTTTNGGVSIKQS